MFIRRGSVWNKRYRLQWGVHFIMYEVFLRGTVFEKIGGVRFEFHIKWGFHSTESRDSSVGIAMGYGLDDRGSRVRFPSGARNFSLHHRVQNSSGTHPASYPMGTRASFPGGKAAGAWSWPHLHLVPISKNAWSYTSTPAIRLHGVVLSLKKAQGQPYLYFYLTLDR
jgi:hypothetical protein